MMKRKVKTYTVIYEGKRIILAGQLGNTVNTKKQVGSFDSEQELKNFITTNNLREYENTK